MPFKSKAQRRKCRYCNKPAKLNIINGKNKGYLKTCGNFACIKASQIIKRQKISQTLKKLYAEGKRQPPMLGFFGERNPNWKGGCYAHSSGYVCIRINGKYIMEHRRIIEEIIGRKLLQGEIVHHLNGIKADNRPENLSVVTTNTHDTKSYIKSLQERIRELEVL